MSLSSSSSIQIKTVLLGHLVNKLVALDRKLATAIVKVDNLIVETPALAKIFRKIEPEPSLKPFLKASLIEKTMKDTLDAEKLRASNPAYKAMLGDSIKDTSSFDNERTYEKFLDHLGGTVYGKTALNTPAKKANKTLTKV